MKPKGLTLIFTGNGKGKSTAAFGLALRALGQGMKVLIVQFIKHREDVGEVNVFRQLADVEIHVMGEGFTWVTKNPVRDTQKALEAWNFMKDKITTGAYSLVILDEINHVTHHDYLKVDEVLRFLKERPTGLHVILTGRHADPRLIEAADLVTEMQEVKHYFKKGIPAQRGLEF